MEVSLRDKGRICTRDTHMHIPQIDVVRLQAAARVLERLAHVARVAVHLPRGVAVREAELGREEDVVALPGALEPFAEEVCVNGDVSARWEGERRKSFVPSLSP